LILLLLLMGCTLEEGKPWGYWMPKLWVSWQADPNRWVDNRLKTANGYLLSQAVFSFTATQISLFYTDINLNQKAFDPSSPPPGCSLCHNDHCHCGDRLVPYSELAGNGNASGANELSVDINQSFSFLLSPTALLPLDQTQIDQYQRPFQPSFQQAVNEMESHQPILSYDAQCDAQSCSLDRTKLTAVKLKISSMTLSALAYLQSDGSALLPINDSHHIKASDMGPLNEMTSADMGPLNEMTSADMGQSMMSSNKALSITLPLTLELTIPINQEIDEGKNYALPISVLWELNAKIVDIFDWQLIQIGLSDEARNQLSAQLIEQLILKTQIDVIFKSNLKSP
jgi:hypothetical protein